MRTETGTSTSRTPFYSPDCWRSSLLGQVPGLIHGVTGRPLGSVDLPPGPHDAVSRALPGIASTWPRWSASQMHGALALTMPPSEAGSQPPVGDALVTREPGHLLVIRVADCVPVLAAALRGDQVVAVAAIHAGWRGVVAGVVGSGLAQLTTLAPGARVLAAMGPAIGPCCYEVGPDVADALRAAGGRPAVCQMPDGRLHADLPAAVAAQVFAADGMLTGEPVPCTRCAPEAWHSYRAQGSAAGRMGAFIGWSPLGVRG